MAVLNTKHRTVLNKEHDKFYTEIQVIYICVSNM